MVLDICGDEKWEALYLTVLPSGIFHLSETNQI